MQRPSSRCAASLNSARRRSRRRQDYFEQAGNFMADPTIKPLPGAVLYLEDLTVGQRYSTGQYALDADQIRTFAAQFDPQSFHLDGAAARGSMFGGLAASGWHTAAVTMRLLVDSDLKPAGGMIGLGFDELRWPRPVRPGDELRVESEVLAVRPSR